MNGDITFTSIPGKGTTFSFTIPFKKFTEYDAPPSTHEPVESNFFEHRQIYEYVKFDFC